MQVGPCGASKRAGDASAGEALCLGQRDQGAGIDRVTAGHRRVIVDDGNQSRLLGPAGLHHSIRAVRGPGACAGAGVRVGAMGGRSALRLGSADVRVAPRRGLAAWLAGAFALTTCGVADLSPGTEAVWECDALWAPAEADPPADPDPPQPVSAIVPRAAQAASSAGLSMLWVRADISTSGRRGEQHVHPVVAGVEGARREGAGRPVGVHAVGARAVARACNGGLSSEC